MFVESTISYIYETMTKLEKSFCPDGTWCVSYTTGFAVLVIVMLSLYIFSMHVKQPPQAATTAPTPTATLTTAPPPPPTTEEEASHSQPPTAIDNKWEIPVDFQQDVSHVHHTSPTITNVYTSPSHNVDMLRAPLRRAPNTTTTNIGLMPINIKTRGETPDIQQVGILRSKSNDKVLALYGRPTYHGSSKWIYYTGTDKYHSIKLPVEKNNRDCTSEYGCDELYEDEEVNVKGSSEVYQTSIYQLDAPRYIPFVVE